MRSFQALKNLTNLLKKALKTALFSFISHVKQLFRLIFYMNFYTFFSLKAGKAVQFGTLKTLKNYQG